MAIWGAYELVRGWRYHAIALAVLGSAAIVLCLGLTRQQLGYWKDNETLFRHALKVTENNDPAAHKALGDALIKQGQIVEAAGQYQEAIRIQPGDAEFHNNLGFAFFNEGQYDKAIRQYQEAIRISPNYGSPPTTTSASLLLKKAGPTRR